MKPAPFDYVRPDGVEAAVAALAEMGDDARPLAGGLSLVPMMNFRLVAPVVVIDVGGIEALKEIADHGPEIEVGAGVTQAAFERWPGLAARLPLAAEAFPHVGHYPTRARGTVGGSIAHADPGAELPLVLVVLDGAVRLRSAGGERLAPARSFFQGPLETACREDEMVVATRWPCAGADAGHAFGEVALRHGDFALAACAVVVRGDRMTVGFGGVADTPIVREWPRLAGGALDDALAGLGREIDVVDDGEGGAEYRRGLIPTLGARTAARAAAAADRAANEADAEPARSPDPTGRPTPPVPNRRTSLPAPPASAPARLAMRPPGDLRPSTRSSSASSGASSISGVRLDPGTELVPEGETSISPGSGSHAAAGPGTEPAAAHADPVAAADPKPGAGPDPGVPTAARLPSAALASGGAAGRPAAPARLLRADERHRVEFLLNGAPCAGEAPPRLLLSDFLRRGFGCKGVHVGCEHGVCGACTVRMDGAPARACLVFAVQAHGRRVDTVEGLAAVAAGPEGSDGTDDEALSPLQEAFRRHHALQCGYCTPGILMTMTEWLERLALEGRTPDEADVRAVLSGHLCRCTGYEPIVAAVLEAAADVVRSGAAVGESLRTAAAEPADA